MAARDTVILGLGNSILRDDAVGLLVARRLQELLDGGVTGSFDVKFNERGGMDVLDAISGYRRAILLDAIKTGRVDAGTLLLLDPELLPPTRRLSGLHDLDLPATLDLADKLGIDRPDEIQILAVEILDDLEFGEECSEPVAAAIQPAAKVALALAQGLPLPEDVPIFFVDQETQES